MAAAETAIGLGKRHSRVDMRYPRYGKESRPVDRMRDSMAGHVMTG
jgi:hypothetical protein